MQTTNLSLVKVALALGMAAFQLHIFTMTVSGANEEYRLDGPPTKDRNNKDNVVQAFLIIAYFLFIFALIFLLVLSYSNIKGNKALSAITALILFFAVASVIIGLAVFGSSTTVGYNSYTISTYATDAACGLVGGIVLLVSLCV